MRKNLTIFDEKYSEYLKEGYRPGQRIFRFSHIDISVIKDPTHEGYEAAILCNGDVCYDDDVFCDTVRGMNEKEVAELIEYVKNHKWPEKCSSCKKKFFSERTHIKFRRKEHFFCYECANSNVAKTPCGCLVSEWGKVFEELSWNSTVDKMIFFRHITWGQIINNPNWICTNTQIEGRLNELGELYTPCTCENCEKYKTLHPPF